MGMLGKYLDSLDDEARDRVLVAQNWMTGHIVDPDGNQCLVGHAEGSALDHVCYSRSAERGFGAAYRQFDGLVYRCVTRMMRRDKFREPLEVYRTRALNHVVRLIKARAGKPNRVMLPAVQAETQAQKA